MSINNNYSCSILLSCMYQDKSIIQTSNVQVDIVVVNQCDEDKREEFFFLNKAGHQCKALFISTTERGLSRSRNMAIRNCDADICLICDDDEILPDNLDDILTSAYETNENADLITFALNRLDKPTSYPKERTKVGFKQILKTSSQSISFRRDRVINKNIRFDEKMGSGTGNGGGEENKFLMDCKRASLTIIYEPVVIATITPGDSKWFKGFTDKYFRDKGWVFRRTFGVVMGYAYLLIFPILHIKELRKDNTMKSAYIHLHMGFFEKR